VPAGAEERTLADFMAGALRGKPVVGDRVPIGGMELVVREVAGNRIARVGLRLPE